MKRLSLDFSRQDYLAMPERSAGARLRKVLAAFELALATLLLIGAGLLIRSLANLERVQLGFTSHGLITFQLGPPTSKYPVIGKGPMLYRGLLEALQSIPGVRSASVSSGIPFGAGNLYQASHVHHRPFGLPGLQHWCLSIGSTLLAVVALAACILPALRAARVLPMVALRHE